MPISIETYNPQDDSHSHYDVHFYDDTIKTLVTHDSYYVENWLSEIQHIHRRRCRNNSLLVGLDVEWRPSFDRYRNPVATLQLCVGRQCLIYQLIHTDGIPAELEEFLDEDYTFPGVGIDADLQKLYDDYEIGGNTSTVDLRNSAVEAYQSYEYQNAGLKKLVRDVLGKEVDKPRNVTLSRWDQRYLSPIQVQYACIDAFASFELGRVLRYQINHSR